MGFRQRQKKSIYPQGKKPWAALLAAALVLVFVVWQFVLPAKKTAPFAPPPSPPAARNAPLGPKVDTDEMLPLMPGKGSKIELPSQQVGGPPASSGGSKSLARGAEGTGDKSQQSDKANWLARWFPGLEGKEGTAGGQPGYRGDSMSPFAGSAAGNAAASLAQAMKSGTSPNYGMKKPSELVPGSGVPGKNPIFLDDAFAEQNKEVIRKFGENAKLNVPLIPGTQYLTLNLDDGLEGINIYQALLGTNVSIVAKAGVVTQAELELFIHSGDTGLPALSGISAPGSLGPATSFPATSGSGLRDSQTWMFTSNGFTIQVALMVRIDNQGSYLAVVKAPGESVTSAEDFYGQYFEQLKIM